MMRKHKVLLTLATAAAVVAATSTTALTQGTQTPCSASFHVLHDDRIGTLRLPEGAYQLRTDGVSCLRASHLFTEFLNHYTGDLPGAWSYSVNGAGDGTFSYGDSGRGFRAVRTGAAQPNKPGHTTDGGGSHGDLTCPGVFEVQHNDRIGPLRLPRGEYTINRLGVRLSCADASRLFERFLEYPSGRLPGGWVLLPSHAEFVKYNTHYGFQVEELAD